MTKTNKRFEKGQVVFYAATNFAAIAAAGKNGETYIREVTLGLVVERVVDACGSKQMTFFDRSGKNDFVFGKKAPADSREYFTNPADAIEYLRGNYRCDVICPDVYSDANDDSFNDLRSGKMRIAEK